MTQNSVARLHALPWVVVSLLLGEAIGCTCGPKTQSTCEAAGSHLPNWFKSPRSDQTARGNMDALLS